MLSETLFTHGNLDLYLKELGKELRKLGGRNAQLEIILVGGASILANYSFRDMTHDVDAIVPVSSVTKEAINRVGDKYGLPSGWLNTDFVRTTSYTPRLIGVSIYYKSFSGIMVRTVAGEHLIATKLKSARRYKNDLSDVVGIISEHSAGGTPLTIGQIKKAVCDLYGSWEVVSTNMDEFLVSVVEQSNQPALYTKYREIENENRKIILAHKQENAQSLRSEADVDSVLEKAKNKKRSTYELER